MVEPVKIKLVAVAFGGLFLTGCLSVLIDGTSAQSYQTKWNQQCLVLTQDVELWKSPKTDSFSKNFIMSKSSTRIARYLKKQDTLPQGTKLEVVEIYDRYIHGSAGNWHLRINLRILDGSYKGLDVEIPGIYTMHPYPVFFTHKTQVIPYTDRENLQPSTIIFNPEYLTECAR